MSAGMLWIAICLPDLPLQLAQRANREERPCAVVDGPAAQAVVRCANPAALDRGVEPGMSVAAARARVGELAVVQRDEAAETRALHNLACWACQFTPGVTLHPAGGLILEVASTLNLHGGLARLLGRIRQGIAGLGYHAEPGIAPTPRAAWLLARARHAGLRVRMCTAPATLPERLANLPLSLLDWPEGTTAPLRSLGIRRIGACLALPRDGFIRRFGAAAQLDLDKILGTAPDPHSAFTPPDRFSARAEFGFEVADALALSFPLKRLLQELEGFLRGRGAGVQRWHLLLEHMNHGRTRIEMGVVAPERSAERFLALARERLARTALMAPVLALEICADRLLPYEACSRSLFPDPRTRAIGWGHLMDRLAARLGHGRIYGVQPLDGHRPERGWRLREAAGPAGPGRAVPLAPGPRPLWLLQPPRALPIHAGNPMCHGRLDLLAGPERIESGWWDDEPAHRDYYVARNPRGETLWIYREHRDSAWYLHGVFG
ncbi:DNA polymerase Y family protein [Nitrosovibrio sp. Nv17]|jgi:protein ImuB|uniref:Y-family DNA polymerase n=1 Tax=Nitrosovibrio sp. Nv17 TaxID=1855339 RepID=UPI000908C02F|nr:DNA polymerase Y family protein [Nitrosovibrio sp. Nv17]SFW34914.1 protein ImuB [Nitrosovibrio sp. Nv17]